MHTQLRRRGQPRWRLALLALCLGGLETSCQSARIGYSFQPLLTAPGAPAAAATSRPPQQPITALEPAPAVAETHPAQRPVRAARPWLGALRRPAAGPGRVARVPVRQPLQFRRAPRATAEAGLGTSVFGVLGLLAVPVGLVGLALGGGLVWGLIAGAGALAVLVAWLDPFGR